MRFAWLLLVVAHAASAAELRSMEVEHERGAYLLTSSVWFDAGVDQTFEAFSTWDYSPQYSSAVVAARDLEPDAQGRPGFFIRNRGCILFFCKSVVRQGWVEYESNRVLRAIADPALSDFEFSNEVWTFDADRGGTLVEYTLHMDPKFWIPPAIGPYMIKRKLRKKGAEALDRVEALARSLD